MKQLVVSIEPLHAPLNTTMPALDLIRGTLTYRPEQYTHLLAAPQTHNSASYWPPESLRMTMDHTTLLFQIVSYLMLRASFAVLHLTGSWRGAPQEGPQRKVNIPQRQWQLRPSGTRVCLPTAPPT